MKRNKAIALGVGITLIYFLINLIVIDDYGLSWDFHYHYYAGLFHLGLPVPSIHETPPVPFTPPDPRLTTEDPFGPFTQIIPSLSEVVFHDKLHLLPVDSAYNLPIVIFGALGVGILFLFMYEAVGIKEALVSACLLGLLPVYFGYLHNDMKDIPNAFAFTLAIYFFWRLEKERGIGNLIGAILSFAFAFNIKINSIFIPVILLLWFLAVNKFPSKRFLPKKDNLTVLSYFILAPVAAIAVWWPFWRNPLGKLLELPFFYSHNTLNIPVLLNGRVFLSGVNIPWYYPYIYIGITTPLPILIAFSVGLLICVRSILSQNKFSNFYFLLILWFFVPLIRYFSPASGAIDGVRHFMEVVFPLVAIASIGGVVIYNRMNKAFPKNTVSYAVCALVFLSLIYNIVHFHPYQTSYFNFLIGGIKGAQGKFDIDFWGTPQKKAMTRLNKNVPQNSYIYVVMAQSSAGVYLRDDLVKRENKKNIWDSDYSVILNRQSFFNDDISLYMSKQTSDRKLLFAERIDGVPLVWVFRK